MSLVPRPKMILTLSRKAYILISIPLAFELLFVALLVIAQIKLENAYEEESRAKAIAVEINQGLGLLVRAGAFTMLQKTIESDRTTSQTKEGVDGDWEPSSENLLKDKNFWLSRARKTAATAGEHWKKVMTLSKGQSAQLQELNTLINDLTSEFDTMNRPGISDLEQKVAATRIYGKLGRAVPLADKVVSQQDTIQERESAKQRRFRTDLKLLIGAGVTFNIILAIALAVYFNRTTLSRLAVLMDNSRRLPDGENLLPSLPGEDELAELDRTFHEMADRLREMRKRETAIITNSADVICSLDLSLKFTFVSKACERLWGYTANELEGKALDCLFEAGVGELDRFKRELLALSESDAANLTTVECRIQKKDGKQIDTLWSLYKSTSEQAIFCVAHDITDRKQVEKMRAEFLAMVSHDIRTPLSSLALTYGLLNDGTLGQLTERGSKLAAGGEQTVKRLIKLISDLLDLERLDAGMLTVAAHDVSSNTIVVQALDSVRTAAEQKSIAIETSGSDMQLQCDPDRIVQVLVNLLENGIKFSPTGTKITINVVEDGNHAEFSVTDQGRGITSEERQSLFTRYKQIDEADRSQHGGSGLGLSISKTLVEAHGGVIGVESARDAGSRFWFRLPRTPSQSERAQQRPPAAHS